MPVDQPVANAHLAYSGKYVLSIQVNGDSAELKTSVDSTERKNSTLARQVSAFTECVPGMTKKRCAAIAPLWYWSRLVGQRAIAEKGRARVREVLCRGNYGCCDGIVLHGIFYQLDIGQRYFAWESDTIILPNLFN